LFDRKVALIYTAAMKLSYTQDKQFPQTHLKSNVLLDECLKTLFPNEEYILDNLKNITRKDKSFTLSYNKGYLAYHTCDTNWLAKYLEMAYNHLQSLKTTRLNPQEQTALTKKIPFSYIRNYVETSPKFDALRSQYEQKLVGAYIQLTQDNKKDDFFAKSIVKIADAQHPQYERLLRDRFVAAMQHLGMDKFRAEIGIELNAHLWRDNARFQTFLNNFRKYDMRNLTGSKGLMARYNTPAWVKLVNMGEQLYEKWSQLAEYDYYQQHRRIIDQLGTVNSHMLIPEDKAAKLEKEVEAMQFTFECMLFDATQKIEQTTNKTQNGIEK